MAQSALIAKNVRIHPTAIVEEGVKIGAGSSVWDGVHIRRHTEIGEHCIIGGKTYIAYGVVIGSYVKINSFVYIPTGVIVEDKVMISAGCIFTNDKYPRSYDYRKGKLGDSGPNEATLETIVREGATIGAAATILGGLELGPFCMVGAGGVVTKSIPAHALVIGNPARQVGWVCRCGPRLMFKKNSAQCRHCQKKFLLRGKKVAAC